MARRQARECATLGHRLSERAERNRARVAHSQVAAWTRVRETRSHPRVEPVKLANRTEGRSLRWTPGPSSHQRAGKGGPPAHPLAPARADWWLRHVGREATPKAVDQVAPHVRTTGKPDVVEVLALSRLGRVS